MSRPPSRCLQEVLDYDVNVTKRVARIEQKIKKYKYRLDPFTYEILQDENIKRLIPYRLELKPKQVLLDWLTSLALRK